MFDHVIMKCYSSLPCVSGTESFMFVLIYFYNICLFLVDCLKAVSNICFDIIVNIYFTTSTIFSIDVCVGVACIVGNRCPDKDSKTSHK